MPRLSQRLSGAQPDGPYEGMPEHIVPGVLYWLQGICGYRGSPSMDGTRLHRLGAHMGLTVSNRPQYILQQLESYAEQDQTFCIDMIDGALDIWAGVNRWSEINNHLESGASVWRVNDDRTGLVRVVSDEAQATFANATAVADQAAKELKEAWAHAFGRNGDASDAWDHAIKAVEHVLIREMMPSNLKATLSHVIGELGGQQTTANWKMVLPGSDKSQNVEPLVAMLRLIWPNHDRHGGTAPTRTPSGQEARAVVTLAATIVQWHREGWVVQRR